MTIDEQLLLDLRFDLPDGMGVFIHIISFILSLNILMRTRSNIFSCI